MLSNCKLMVRVVVLHTSKATQQEVDVANKRVYIFDPDSIPSLGFHRNVDILIHPMNYILRHSAFTIGVILYAFRIRGCHKNTDGFKARNMQSFHLLQKNTTALITDIGSVIYHTQANLQITDYTVVKSLKHQFLLTLIIHIVQKFLTNCVAGVDDRMGQFVFRIPRLSASRKSNQHEEILR